MDRDEPIEPLRERAASSEPASFRPKPFDEDDDDDQSSSRKRQRMESDNPQNMPAADSAPAVNGEGLTLPTTPTRIANPSTNTPNSNRVTLNLRSTRDLEPSSSPTLNIPSSPSKAPVNGSDPALMDAILDRNNDSEVDAINVHPSIETPSSSLSSGEPEVMLVEDEPEYFSPAVAIIDNEAISEDEVGDQTYSFPFLDEEQSLARAAIKLSNHFESGTMHNDNVFNRLYLWIERYITYAHQKPDEAYDSFCANKDFWDAISDVIRSLSVRKPHFGNWLKTDAHARKSLSNLLRTFGSLTGLFVSMDIAILTRRKENPETNLVTASQRFLEVFGFLFNQVEPEHVGQYLRLHYAWDWENELSNMHAALEDQGGSLRAFIELARLYLELVPSFPKMTECLREPCHFVALSLRYSKLYGLGLEHLHACGLAYNIFLAMERHLNGLIEKNATYLGIENLLAQIAALTDILEIVMEVKDGPAEERLQEASLADPKLRPGLLPRAAAYRWKFTMLNKMITSSQMQLRVGGTAMFCAELLKAYHAKTASAASNDPLLRNYADFIVKANLVDYIVGVASHPEIIAAAGDMIGFLAATKTYTNDHADKIWSTVKSSQDPRVVESVLMSQKNMVNLLDTSEKMYLCKKLQEIPVEAFTAVMRDFCEMLFNFIRKEAKDRQLDVEAPPYDVCVRLIRESTLSRSASPTDQNIIQQWASQQFEFLVKREDRCLGPDTPDRIKIYKRCISDLRGGSVQSADGSLIVISILVESNQKDLRVLFTEHNDFMRLVIENFSWRNSNLGITKHLRLFQLTIEKNFINDSSNLGVQLWNKVIGAEEAGSEGEERQLGWKMLTKVMKTVKPDNAFIKACIHSFLPNLPPRLFSKASLAFARGAIGFRNNTEPLIPEHSGSAINSRGVEQLWRMVFEGHDDIEFQSHAITELINFYLESTVVLSSTRESIIEVHVAFVDRCLEQLMMAAKKLKSFSEGTMSGDDEPMVIVASDEEVHEQELIFSRSLSLLKTFLRNYGSNPRYNQAKIQPQVISPPDTIKGETMNVSYQVFDETSNSPVQTLTIGKLNSGASLLGSLQKAAGFKHFRVHHFGREVTAAEVDLSKSLEELRLGTHLMLVSRVAYPGPWADRSPVQVEVMKRLNGLFELLAMDSAQAKEIHEFLTWFPPYGKLLESLVSEDMSCNDLFPPMYPYRSLYAMHCLQHLSYENSKPQTTDPNRKLRCFNLLVENLVSHEVYSRGCSDQKSSFYVMLIDSLGFYTAEPFFAEYIAGNSKVLLDQLMVLISDTQKSSSHIATVLLFKAFWLVLIMSGGYQCFWAEFKKHPNTKRLVQFLLLGEWTGGRGTNAVDPKTAIDHVCSHTSSATGVDQVDILQFFWPILVELVPEAILHPDRCADVLSLVQKVLKGAVEVSKTKDVSIDRLDLGTLAMDWGQLLVSHEVIQYVGRLTTVDHVAHDLSSLLLACIRYMDLSALEPLRTMAAALFNKHLFPDLPMFLGSDSDPRIEARLPLLDTTTRQLIIDIIVSLIQKDPQSYMCLMMLTTRLVPHPAENDGTYQFELSQCFDRSRVIRSATGYVGLKNLSNTCYLNSLMTQLFMNLSFREFMLDAHVADGSSQNLLDKTQKLFAEMQNGVMRCADPHEFAQSIRTYEEGHIDISVQMDVDEFYNLLFDRWESQILAADAKTAFRSFYGGQLVQQVKSKECEHISERLEPFSAIQCDIKGKMSLLESLEAYVKGEIMEGDNKYKCSTCDQHVDAVKRACLKDVPDNLIFHLKRFDYDLRACRRNKLNDYFSFPTEIDMRPYKVDYLTGGPDCAKEDIFELVGVLVHAGTAESGHYYSYIRERPSSEDNHWVEFNDDQVSPFDPGNIEACCFGGQNFQGTGEFQFEKTWSAYMLFYQRKSFLDEQKQKLAPLIGIEPVKLPIRAPDAALIRDDNLLQMRKYVLYDPSHALFVKQLLHGLPLVRGGDECSSEHKLENEALAMTFNHMDQVFGRTKDTPDFRSFVTLLCTMFEECTRCSSHFLNWIIKSPEACRQFLVKSPDDVVRVGIADLIITALKTLKLHAPHEYGLLGYLPSTDQMMSHHNVHELNEENGIFGRVVEAICLQWDNVLVMVRAWPQYFKLVSQLMTGNHEAALLMDNRMLEKTIHIIEAHYNLDPPPEISRMLNLLARRFANKAIPYDPVLCLMDNFLKFIDLISDPPSSQEPFRTHQLLENLPLTLSRSEFRHLSVYWDPPRDNIFVSDLVRLSMTEPATQSILEQILLKMPVEDDEWRKSIFTSIREMLHKAISASWNPVPQLRSALTFCRYIDNEDLFSLMVDSVKEFVKDSEVYGGGHYLQFFKDLMNLPDTRIKLSKPHLLQFCLRQIEFWGPPLLLNYDEPVRLSTEEYIRLTILRFTSDPEDREDGRILSECCAVVARTLGMKCFEYLLKHYVRPNMQILNSQISCIKDVIDACRPFYENGSEEQIEYANYLNRVWPTVLNLGTDHLEDEGSNGSDDWDASGDDLSTSSLVLEDRDPVSLIDNTNDL